MTAAPLFSSQAHRSWAPGAASRASRQRRALRPAPCRASLQGDSGAGAHRPLTLSEAYAVLGLQEGSSYDDVLAAKNRELQASPSDAARCTEVEAAYDRIFTSQAGRLASHLDLLYRVSQASRSEVERCECCRGSGEEECGWCHGTGAMTVGDMLYCSEGGCHPCPVCRGKGYCPCPHCRGTGRRASWLAK